MSNLIEIQPSIPVLFDKALKPLQDYLESNLPWLNTAYGKAYRQVRSVNERQYFYPAVHDAKTEHLNMEPDGLLGNYSWFDVSDPLEVINMDNSGSFDLKANVGLILSFDIRNVNPNWKDMTISNVQQEVIVKLIEFGNVLLELGKQMEVQERSENIFSGYSYKQLDQNYLMRPYGCFRINFDVIAKTSLC